MTAQTSPLLAALDAIEETARRAAEDGEYPSGDWWGQGSWWLEGTEMLTVGKGSGGVDIVAYAYREPMRAHIALHDPAFTLRLVEGLREVMALHRLTRPHDLGSIGWAKCSACGPASTNGCATIRALTRALTGEEEG